jgi:arginyl-tRNA synthetase
MLKHKLVQLLNRVCGGDANLELSPPGKPDFGHYSTNFALRRAKKLGRRPMAVAEEIAEKIRKIAPPTFIQNIQIAPPGFINFWLTPEAFWDEFQEINRQGKRFGGADVGRGKKVIVEYSSPNIAKPMHIGHLRNTVLGDALARVYEFLGYKVIRWNYIGDWGTQFGNLIAAYKKWGKKSEVEKEPIGTLLKLYIRFHEEAGKHPELEELGRQEFRKLEAGEKVNRHLWSWFRKMSLQEFNRVYKTLGVKFDVEIGESFFEKDLVPLVLELVRKKIAVESQGALIIPLDAKNLPPALIRKADGASLYLTREIANLKYRLQKYRPAKIIYVVANEQTLHFEQLFAVAKLLGLGRGTELMHVKYGLVLDEGGKKFSTREGRTISASEVLEKAVRLARETVEKKNPDLSAKEKGKIARAVGIGAVKYILLRENRNSTVVFDWKRMLDMRGDSAPYLQYTYARLKSILRKAGKRALSIKPRASRLAEEGELTLIHKLAEFPEALKSAAENYAVNVLAAYLYDLANAVNSYYESTPILKDKNKERKEARLALIASAARILKSGLELLGISAPEKI